MEKRGRKRKFRNPPKLLRKFLKHLGRRSKDTTQHYRLTLGHFNVHLKVKGKRLEQMHLEDVEDFLTNTEDARQLSERDRDYKDNKQWTDAEIAKLNSRNQAPIIVNRIKPKVEGLKGLLIQRKTDPKAYPRTQKHTAAADAVTDGLRFVADNVDFDQIKLDVADNVFVEGYGAAITEVAQIGPEIEITITHIPWDRYYYDNHSRRLDFADKRFDGIILWMDIDQAKDVFELSDEEVQTILDEDVEIDNNGFETFDDRPRWIDKKEKRLRVCQHFFIEDSVWKMTYFTKNRFLVDQQESPYLDEFGIPTNPIESQAANIDRENNRFGEVRYWIDLQDEINHRRSKFLHLLNNRQTVARKGAITDIPAFKREMSKPDGHGEYNGEKGDLEFIPTNEMKDGQFLLYQDGKGELDALGFNAQLSGERQGDLSGRAISNLQQAATNELSSLYAGLANWEKRIYRQIWMRMKQFWKKEFGKVPDDFKCPYSKQSTKFLPTVTSCSQYVFPRPTSSARLIVLLSSARLIRFSEWLSITPTAPAA